MPRLLLLTSAASGTPHNDNHLRLPAALRAHGWCVTVLPHHSVELQRGEVRFAGQPAADFDLIWVLGLGSQRSFLDRCQILANLSAERFVNSPAALLQMHGKHAVLPHSPPAWSGHDTEQLLRAAGSGAPGWVVKPAAGSFGRGVRFANDAQQLRDALEIATRNGNYCVVQQRVDTSAGELRLLMLAGEVIGAYRRQATADGRHNLVQGAAAIRAVPTARERQIAQDVAAALRRRGVAFAAVDLATPWLIEANIANPGGLATLAELQPESYADTQARLARALRRLLPG